MIVDQGALGLGDGLFDRVQLLSDVEARLAAIDHGDDAAQMAFGASQPLYYVGVRGVSLLCHAGIAIPLDRIGSTRILIECLNLAVRNGLYLLLTMSIRAIIQVARALSICAIALAVLTVRMPTVQGDSRDSTYDIAMVEHDHHGHTHDDDEGSPSSGPDHEPSHVGDHSHDTPTAPEARHAQLREPVRSIPGLGEVQFSSMKAPPGDRPPRIA